MSPKKNTPDELSYEQARDELEAIVAQLETGGLTLEDALALWEHGEALAIQCQTWLDSARARLEPGASSTDDEG